MKIAKKIAQSVSDEQTRYYLNGFFMHKADDGKHYAVSTDGHRMTRIEVNPDYSGVFPSVIFPTATIKQILSFKPDRARREKAVVTVQVDPERHHYEMTCGDVGVSGKLVDGTYPDYNRVIPNFESYQNEYGDCGFSPKLLSEIFEAASYCVTQFRAIATPVRMFFQEGSPAVILESKDPSVMYVIMPMRSSFKKHSHPSVSLDDVKANAVTAA